MRSTKLSIRLFLFGLILKETAAAAPISIPFSEAVGRPRPVGEGGGLCGTAVHIDTMATPFNSLTTADSFLYTDVSMNIVDGKISRPFLGVNLHGPALTSKGVFGSSPLTPAQMMPYSSTASNPPTTMKMMHPNENIAVRFRGYINIDKPTVVNFLLGCDDQCRFFLGVSRQDIIEVTRPGEYQAKPVEFQSAGLYPVDILYFQNSGDNRVEWAWTLNPMQLDEGVLASVDTKKYEIVPSKVLFSEIAGSSGSCQECKNDFKTCPKLGMTSLVCTNGLCAGCNNIYGCGDACMACTKDQHLCSFLEGGKGNCVGCVGNGDCGNGSFCNVTTKTCGICNQNAHCGPTCTSCPATTPVCNVDHCVGCLNDEHCSSHVCDTTKTICVDTIFCKQDADCMNGMFCDTDRKVCLPPITCTNDGMCPPGRKCDTQRQLCTVILQHCDSSQNMSCQSDEYCDLQDQVCRLNGPEELRGGGGCNTIPSSALGMLGIVFLILSSGLFYTGRKRSAA